MSLSHQTVAQRQDILTNFKRLSAVVLSSKYYYIVFQKERYAIPCLDLSTLDNSLKLNSMGFISVFKSFENFNIDMFVCAEEQIGGGKDNKK